MPKTINGVEYFTLKEAAPMTGYCVQHLRKKIKLGQVGAVRIGKKFYFTAGQVLAATPKVEPVGPLTAPPSCSPAAADHDDDGGIGL